MSIQACTQVQPAWLQEVVNSYVTNPEAQRRLTELALSSPDDNGYSLQQGLIRLRGRVWLGANSALQTKLISAFHASAIGGRSGVEATYQRLKHLFTWAGMKAAVQDFVRKCDICQDAKHINQHPQGLLQPLPVPVGAWQDITLDFVEGLPVFEGANAIIVVVDRFTKYAHFIPMKHPFSAPQVARVFIDSVVKLHGMPRSIISDRGAIFTSHFWRKLFQKLGTKLKFTTAYHPQTDGQIEGVNQSLEMYLRCSIQENSKNWKQWISLAKFWYNSAVHSAIGMSPFKALYGHEPNLGAMPATEDDTDLPAMLINRAAQLKILKKNLSAARNRMKLKADMNRTEKEFAVGDKVLLKLQPYVQHSVVTRPYPKLAYKYFGPYEILERNGKVAYKLQLPQGTLIHPVFHVSQLKEHRPDYTPVFAVLPVLPELDTMDTTPEKILNRRMVKKGNATIVQVLIKWTNLPEDAATWEDWAVLTTKFPEVLA
jgi:hypothetical protein